MKEIFERIKLSEMPKKNVIAICIGIVVILILMLSGFSESDEKVSVENTSVYADEYIKETEKRLESLLREIDGAGKVEVMLTLESCYENVYAKSYSTKSQTEDNGDQAELTEQYVIVKKGSNNEECLVVKVYEPEVKGVAIVAQGADKDNVKTAITETVCAVLDVSSAKVSVEKMNG